MELKTDFEKIQILVIALIVKSIIGAKIDCVTNFIENPSNNEISSQLTSETNALKWISRIPSHDELADEVQFWCINPNDSDFRQIFIDIPVNMELPVSFIIHGFRTSIDLGPWMKETAESWIAQENRTVCLVDWGRFAHTGYLIAARKFTKIVGAYLAEFIQMQRLEPSETILVGFSLGAHIAGFCGKELNGSLKLIYGIDPAGPLFTYPVAVNSSSRLVPGDAQHVQVLHTNCGLLGTSLRCGDSDYYANFCHRQPQCLIDQCDHRRAVLIFKASLDPENKFGAKNCENFENAQNNLCIGRNDRFGIHGNHLNGQFYFSTTGCYPFVENLNSNAVSISASIFLVVLPAVNFILERI